MAKTQTEYGCVLVGPHLDGGPFFGEGLFDPPRETIATYINVLGCPNSDNPSDPDDKVMVYIMFRVPEGSDYLGGTVDFKEFMQCIGSDDGISVEIKRRVMEPDWPKGVLRLYVVGKPEAADEPEESAEVEGIGEPVQVRPSEVLSKTEALELYIYYYYHDTVPDGWHLRERPDFADFSGAQTRFVPYT